MFGESTVGNALGIGVALLFGVYVHYRVSLRKTQTRLAVCMLEEEDAQFVDDLERLVNDGAIHAIKDPYATPLVRQSQARRRRSARSPKFGTGNTLL